MAVPSSSKARAWTGVAVVSFSMRCPAKLMVCELGVTVPDEEAERCGPVAEVHDQAAGLLSGPGAAGMLGDAEDVDVPGGHFRHELDVQAAQ